jgi:hypothetical protein
VNNRDEFSPDMFNEVFDTEPSDYNGDDVELTGLETDALIGKFGVDLASDISVTDTSYGRDADNNLVLRFVLTFTYAEKAFSPNISGIAIKLSVDGNVTDSYLGIPRKIFEERATDL